MNIYVYKRREEISVYWLWAMLVTLKDVIEDTSHHQYRVITPSINN